jgi:glucokinase
MLSTGIRHTLAADVGGTKTLVELGVLEAHRYHRIHASQFQNADFIGVAQVLEAFLATAPIRPAAIHTACLALAGPITGRRVRLTNLPWDVDADALASQFTIGNVRLVNDFVAVGHGIASLRSSELSCIQAGKPDKRGARGVLGAGTGLGMVSLVWTSQGYRVVPSEGGNADFAPINEVQQRLWSYLSHRLGRVWCGALLSGRGLERIYQFLSETDTLRLRTSSAHAESTPVAAAEITNRALEGGDPRAVSTMHLFLEIYGAVAGNLALMLMAQGGIYIAGGIAPRIASMFGNGDFLRAFRAKGKFADLMQTFPLYVVLAPDVGLRGAVAIAARSALRRT